MHNRDNSQKRTLSNVRNIIHNSSLSLSLSLLFSNSISITLLQTNQTRISNTNNIMLNSIRRKLRLWTRPTSPLLPLSIHDIAKQDKRQRVKELSKVLAIIGCILFICAFNASHSFASLSSNDKQERILLSAAVVPRISMCSTLPEFANIATVAIWQKRLASFCNISLFSTDNLFDMCE